MIRLRRPIRGPERRRLFWLLLALIVLVAVTTDQRHRAAHADDIVPAVLAADGDRTATTGDLILKPGDVVEHNAIALLGNIEVPVGATVKNDVHALNGNITIAGTVDHDVIATNGDVTLSSTARVGHDVQVINGTLNREPGAQVGGNVRESTAPAPDEDREVGGILGLIARLFGNLGLGLVFVVLGTLLVLVAARPVERVVTALEIAPWPAAGVGIVTGVFLVPVLALVSLVLVITIVGILVLPFLWLAVGVAWAAGLTVMGLWTGRRLAESGRLPAAANGSLLVTAACGMAALAGVLALLSAIVPWLGTLVTYFVGFVGLGAGLLSRIGGVGHLPWPVRPAAPRTAPNPNPTRPLDFPPHRKAG
jgi:hypothetical protein